MRSFSHTSTPVIGYASLCLSRKSKHFGLHQLRKTTLAMPIAVDIFAEEIHPSSAVRPMWQHVLDLIEMGNAKKLIVPSLFHVAGGNSESMSRALTFFKINGVRLISLKEKLDSRKHSRREIMSEFRKSAATAVFNRSESA